MKTNFWEVKSHFMQISFLPKSIILKRFPDRINTPHASLQNKNTCNVKLFLSFFSKNPIQHLLHFCQFCEKKKPRLTDDPHSAFSIAKMQLYCKCIKHKSPIFFSPNKKKSTKIIFVVKIENFVLLRYMNHEPFPDTYRHPIRYASATNFIFQINVKRFYEIIFNGG